MSRMQRIRLLIAAAMLLLSFGTNAAFADVNFNQGVAAYQKKDYKRALIFFQQATRVNPYDANSIYYSALCQQSMGNQREAEVLYGTLVSSFSYSPAGKLAASALGRLNPQYLQQLQPSGQSLLQPKGATAAAAAPPPAQDNQPGWESNDFDSLPQEARIPFTRDRNLIMIDALINNRPAKMIFDTGAEMVAFGKNHLAQYQIAAPEGKPVGKASGVGAGQGVNIWALKADLKVGPILRRGFTVYVQDELPTPPLLGQTFFRDFQYTIDSNSNDRSTGTIHFVKRSLTKTSQANDRYTVPFTRAGNNLLVNVEVNGRSMQMYFDTGADGTCFSTKHLTQAGLTIPPDAIPEQRTGIGGTTNGFGFTVNTIKLGPIEKHDVYVTAVESSNMNYPLLGQTFFGDWQYTIDNTANVIKFVRR